MKPQTVTHTTLGKAGNTVIIADLSCREQSGKVTGIYITKARKINLKQP